MYLGTKSSRRPTWVKCKNSAFQHKPGDSRRLPPAPKNHGQFLLQSSSTTSCAKSCCFVSSRTSWKLTPLWAPNHAVFTGFQERCKWRKLRKTILDFLWKGGNGRNLLQLQSPAQPLGHMYWTVCVLTWHFDCELLWEETVVHLCISRASQPLAQRLAHGRDSTNVWQAGRTHWNF